MLIWIHIWIQVVTWPPRAGTTVKNAYSRHPSGAPPSSCRPCWRSWPAPPFPVAPQRRGKGPPPRNSATHPSSSEALRPQGLRRSGRRRPLPERAAGGPARANATGGDPDPDGFLRPAARAGGGAPDRELVETCPAVARRDPGHAGSRPVPGLRRAAPRSGAGEPGRGRGGGRGLRAPERRRQVGPPAAENDPRPAPRRVADRAGRVSAQGLRLRDLWPCGAAERHAGASSTTPRPSTTILRRGRASTKRPAECRWWTVDPYGGGGGAGRR